jgi:hypothetical protein
VISRKKFKNLEKTVALPSDSSHPLNISSCKKSQKKTRKPSPFSKNTTERAAIHPSSSSVPIAHILVLTLRGASIIASAVTTGTTQQLPALSTEKQHARKIWPPPSVVEEGGRKKEITFGVCVCVKV